MDKFFERFPFGPATLSVSELSICLGEKPPRLTDCPETIQLRCTPLNRIISSFDREIQRELVNQAKTHASMVSGDDQEGARKLRRMMRQSAFRTEYYQILYFGPSGKILTDTGINAGSDSHVYDISYDQVPQSLGVILIHNHPGENPFSQGDAAHIIGKTAIALNPKESALASAIGGTHPRFLNAILVGDNGFHLMIPTIESIQTWSNDLQLSGRVGKAAGDWEEWRRGVNTKNWRILKQEYDLGKFEGPRFAHSAAIRDFYPEEANNHGVAIVDAMFILWLSNQLSFPLYFAPKEKFRSTGMLFRAREITDYFPKLNALLLPNFCK